MKKNTLTVLMHPESAALDDLDGVEPVEETVTAMLCDQMRAELEVKKRHQVSVEDAGINFVSIMAWCALARQGRISCKLEEFAQRVYEIEREDPDDAADVDPTQPAASSDSAWSSPSPTPALESITGVPASTPATTS